MDAQLHQSGSQSSLSQAHVERGSLQSHREIDALRCVLPWLPQRDLCAAACVSRELRTAAYQPELWKSLSLQGATSASARLAQALTQPRFSHLQHLNLEFAQPITDADLLLLAGKPLVSLNLNACQQVTDQGVTTAAKLLPNLQSFSLYWNLRVTDSGVKQVVLRCTSLQTLNLSGCKNITDTALRFISTSLPNLKSLNLTRCVRATDTGLKYVTSGCTQLEELLLYALSSFTDESLATIGRLSHLRVLDLCGMKHLTDQGLQGIACCTHLISLNLSWCVLITDQSLITVASSCHYLELLSLHGIRGVTDASMAALSASCVNTLHTLDVNGCVGIEDRSHAHLKVLFPKLTCFTVHK
ncbi:hypothetical protein CLOM_g6121 [Closterium sp. NIES-68]|nr:hypothetical protein CLOM_g6121 [Closterium sp. NIES-68]GJP86740.1 hypothetical protein CLOP_g16728 [Closterium sp. NIES-67]